MTRVQSVHEDVVWRPVAEARSGTVVELMHSEGDLMRSEGIEAQLLGKELLDEAVHVLVAATLPRIIGMDEEEVGIKGAGNPFMPGESFPLSVVSA